MVEMMSTVTDGSLARVYSYDKKLPSKKKLKMKILKLNLQPSSQDARISEIEEIRK